MAFCQDVSLLLPSSRWNEATLESGTSKLDLNEMPPSCSCRSLLVFMVTHGVMPFLLPSSKWRSKRTLAQFGEVSCQSRQVEDKFALTWLYADFFYLLATLPVATYITCFTLRRWIMGLSGDVKCIILPWFGPWVKCIINPSFKCCFTSCENVCGAVWSVAVLSNSGSRLKNCLNKKVLEDSLSLSFLGNSWSLFWWIEKHCATQSILSELLMPRLLHTCFSGVEQVRRQTWVFNSSCTWSCIVHLDSHLLRSIVQMQE